MSKTIRDNVLSVKEKINNAAVKSNRNPDDVQLVAVSKLQPIEKIHEAYRAGISLFGENRVQELLQKTTGSGADLTWHMVGHLQTNKVRKVIDKVAMIQSVDSLHLINKISDISNETGHSVHILLQVNTSNEESKFGFQAAEVAEACALVASLDNICVEGLMTIGPLTSDQRQIVSSFEALRKLSENLNDFESQKIEMRYLSMGMTDDFEIAIREGSNMVRLGTAIFGPRM